MRYWTVLILLFALVCGFASAQALTASPSQINKTVGQGQFTVTGQDIAITNPGAATTITAALTPAVTWAAVQFIGAGSNLPAGTTLPVLRIEFTPQSLGVGSYNTSIVVTAPGRPNLSIPVTLQVAAPTLTVNPSAPGTFTQRVGTTASYPFQVDYNGPGSVVVSIPTNVSWLSVQPSTLSTFPSNISAVVNTAGLTAGNTYEANLVFTASALSSVPAVTVPLRILVASTLAVQPQEVTFTGSPGTAASNPALLPITVSNSGAATNYFITPSPSAPWIRVNKTTGFVAADGSDTFEIRTDATALTSTGEVVGTVEITAVGRPSSIVTVRLQLSGAQDITVSPATLTFAGQAGASTSAPNLATVTVANAGAATGYNISVDQPWLVVSKTSGTLAQNGTDTFTVTASPQFQTVGAKTGTITISASGRAPRSVSVTFNVTATPPPPDLSVNPTTLSFTAQAGVASSVPASSTVSVGNVGPAVGYTISADQSWVILDKLAGTIPENGSDTFPVRITGVGQSTGTRTATITVFAQGRTQRTITVTGTFTTSDPSQDLTVTPGTLVFAGQVGTATSAPTATTVTVRNTGAAATYNIASDQPWLLVSKSSGTVAENGTDTFTVSANPQGQTAGTKTGAITVTASGRPARVIAVTFNVTVDPPATDLIISPNTASFSAAAGDLTATPAAETITLTNIGQAVGFSVAADQAWIELSTLAGTIPTNGTATFTIAAKPQGLTAGTRTGTVSISALGRPARSVLVTLAVREGTATADMTISPAAVAFAGQAGTSAAIPSSAVVTISNAGSAVAYSLVSDQSWVVLSKTSGTLPQGGSDTFLISANPQNQTPGVKIASVSVIAAGRPTRTVQVSLQASSGTPTPELLVVPQALSYTGAVGAVTGTPASQTVTITNVGGAVGYTIGADQSWIKPSKLAGSIAQNGTDAFEVGVSAEGLPAGVRTGTITISALGRPSKTVSVSFTVESTPQPVTNLTVAPATLGFTSVLGQPTGAPSPWRLTLANTGPAVNFLAAPDQPWLVLSQATGTLPLNGEATLQVSVNTSFISTAGTRTGNIIISADGRATQTVAVTLNVVQQEPAADLQVLPTSLAFSQPTGQTTPSPAQAMLQVGNVGAQVGYTVTTDQAWVLLSKNSGNVPQNGTDFFTVSANSSGLSAGTRTATILVSAAGRVPRAVAVTLTIGGTAGQDNLSVTPTSLTTTGAVGGAGTTPALTTVTVSNTGAAVQYGVTANQTWIGLSKLNGLLAANGTDTFTISTFPLNLAIGTYQGQVVVAAPGRPTATISVTMILTATGQVTRLESFPPQLDFFSTPGMPVLGQSLRVTTSDASATTVNVSTPSAPWLISTPTAITTPGQVSLTLTNPPSSLPVSGIVALAPTSQSVLSADVPVNLRGAGAPDYTIPRIADGAGFSTSITIANLDTSQAVVSLRFRRVLPDSTTVTWTPGMEGNQPTENVVIPVGGSVTWRTRGLGNQVDAGWVRIVTAQRINGFAIFKQTVPGRADQEAAVPMVSGWQQRLLLPFDNTNNLVTSMAISNVSETENGDVRAIFRDENGAILNGSFRRVLPPQGHTAFATTEELSFLRNRRGTAEFVMAGGRMSALGLRFAASAFTSFEVQSLNMATSGRLILPQIANAGGFFTTITLVNRDIVPAVVNLRFFRRTNAEGASEPWNPPMVNNQPTQNVTIPPGSSVIWQTTGTGDAAQGWGEVLTSQQVSGFAVFLQRVSGRVDQEAAVPVNAGEQRRFLVPFDNTTPFTTTMAIANASEDSDALIVAAVRDEANNTLVQQIGFIIPRRGHLAFTLPERFPQSAGRRGTIEILSQFGYVSAVGLRFAGQAFTSFSPQVF